VDRYKKEQIVEGHVLSTPVVKVQTLSVFFTSCGFCAELCCHVTRWLRKSLLVQKSQLLF